jgi:hypothetical protein
MSGREQPYLYSNGTGVYSPTAWVDDVPGIQDGTPIDEQNLNNMETGINSANLFAEFLAEIVCKHEKQIEDLAGEVITVTLKNTQDTYTNNSAQTIALETKRDTLDYTVDAEIQGDTINVGDIVIYDKQVNGFKVKYTGSASSATVKLYVHGGNAA